MKNILQIATLDADNNVVEVHDAPEIQEWIELVSLIELGDRPDYKRLISLIKQIKGKAISYSMAIEGI